MKLRPKTLDIRWGLCYNKYIKSKGDTTMKNMITGTKAWEMAKNAERRFTERKLVKDDPWWGKAYETVRCVVVEGKTYEHTTDRDGWDVLIEVEG